jgi:hypothetical protein
MRIIFIKFVKKLKVFKFIFNVKQHVSNQYFKDFLFYYDMILLNYQYLEQMLINLQYQSILDNEYM